MCLGQVNLTLVHEEIEVDGDDGGEDDGGVPPQGRLSVIRRVTLPQVGVVLDVQDEGGEGGDGRGVGEREVEVGD